MKHNEKTIWTVSAAVFSFVGLSGMLILPASAYLDAATTTMFISGITAAVVAVGSVFFICWRKFKHKVSKSLGIDENAHKEVEGDIVIDDTVKSASEDVKVGAEKK